MCNEPTDGEVSRLFVGDRWGAIDFVSGLRFLIRYLPPRPTETSPNQDNQGQESDSTENAEYDYRDEPCPKTFADLEHWGGPRHDRSSEIVSSNKERWL